MSSEKEMKGEGTLFPTHSKVVVKNQDIRAFREQLLKKVHAIVHTSIFQTFEDIEAQVVALLRSKELEVLQRTREEEEKDNPPSPGLHVSGVSVANRISAKKIPVIWEAVLDRFHR